MLQTPEHVANKYRIKIIFFEDDNLTFDLKRFEAICDKIIGKSSNLIGKHQMG
jgi:hypothetical protein